MGNDSNRDNLYQRRVKLSSTKAKFFEVLHKVNQLTNYFYLTINNVDYFLLVPKLQLGNALPEALASCVQVPRRASMFAFDGKLELPRLRTQAGA